MFSGPRYIKTKNAEADNMKKVEIQSPRIRKKILPLVMALANTIIDELDFVKTINKAVEWDKSHWLLSPGALAKALVLSTFMELRVPLTHLQDRLYEIDMGYLIGEYAEAKDVNSSNVGRALERIGKTEIDSIFETLSLSAIQQNDIPVKRLHSDTTTISFYGEYDEDAIELTETEREELLRIEKGYNKDGRPGCNQVVVGQITNEMGIPLVSRTMDGSTSDVDWNKEALNYLEELMTKGFTEGIYVADSKLVTRELIGRMQNPENPIKFVSRCPASFENKLEARMIEKAHTYENWEELGTYHEEKNASIYCGVSLIEEVCGNPMRLLVLRSSSLEKKANEALIKKKDALKPIKTELEKKEFICRADAEEEINRVNKLKELTLFDCVYDIEKITREKWPRGRRGKTTRPIVEEKYRIKLVDSPFNKEKSDKYIKEESCFVIISNVLDDMSNYDLLKTYKGQQVVENSFRQLKGPHLASVIYLKNPLRIKALTMLLSFSLLIRAIIQHRMRKGLEEFNEKNPGEVIYAGWGGRPLKNPTYKLFFEHSRPCHFVRENWDYYSFCWLHGETENRVLPLLELMGIKLENLIV
jgi:transposase